MKLIIPFLIGKFIFKNANFISELSEIYSTKRFGKKYLNFDLQMDRIEA
jgi:hypothetical protein